MFFNKPLNPEKKYYNIYYPVERTFYNVGGDYKFFWKRFSLLGETVLEWDDKDLEHYHARCMAMDSMLCRFKTIYPTERIDSVRYLLEDNGTTNASNRAGT